MSAPAAPPYLVIADDLTGAAELAAVGARRGLRATVLAAPVEETPAADLIVFDTDSRLKSQAIAVACIRALATQRLVATARLVYKKTDSVLRGHVRAELEALAAARHVDRILLVPANPGLGRIVRGGCYRIDERPLADTAFARDPHHPVTSSDVLELLGESGALRPCSLPPGSPLPDHCLVVGDAVSAADMATWAAQVDSSCLPAGAAGFFAALLDRHGWKLSAPVAPPPRQGPLLVISGTKNPAGGMAVATIDMPGALLTAVTPAAPSTVGDDWQRAVLRALKNQGIAHVSAAGAHSPDPEAPARIRAALAELTGALHAQGAFRHLAVEGGATAAAIVQGMRWAELDVFHVWEQGIVTLRPAATTEIDLTIKPGSYAWPPALQKLWLAAGRK